MEYLSFFPIFLSLRAGFMNFSIQNIYKSGNRVILSK